MKHDDALITWEWLKAALPHDLDSLAKSTGAVQRWRKVVTGEQLLWMCLVYAQAFMSLRATAGLSVGFGGVTEGAVKHRLRRAGPFLEAILSHLFNAQVATAASLGLPRSVRLIDSTPLSVPGSHGSDFRVHACYTPGQGFGVEVTDASSSESAQRGTYHPTDVTIGDQGYCRAKDLHHVHEQGAYSLVRAYLGNIRLLVDGQQRLDIQQLLDRADAGLGTSITVYVPYKDKQPIQARLIVRVLAQDKADAAQKKLRRRASRHCLKVTQQGLRLAGYLVVLTTIPAECLSDREVLELYRLRWQIELLFKRWKSLLGLDKLDADEPALATTFCLAKLIEAALLERLGIEALDRYADSCTDNKRPTCTMWRVTAVYHAAFQAVVISAFPVSDRQICHVIDRMREGKRRRKNASEKTARVLARLAQYVPVKEAA